MKKGLSKKLFCTILCFAIVFSQMSMAFADVVQSNGDNIVNGGTIENSSDDSGEPDITEPSDGQGESNPPDSSNKQNLLNKQDQSDTSNLLDTGNPELITPPSIGELIENTMMQMVYEGQTSIKMSEAFDQGSGQWKEGTDDGGNPVNGASYSYYAIADDTDWNAFAACVSAGNTLSGKTVYLTEEVSNLTVSEPVAGTFSGTFDGNEKTMTLSIASSNVSVGLFSTLSGTVKNLILTGSVSAKSETITVNSGTEEETEQTLSCSYIGSVAGTAETGASIKDVTSDVVVNGNSIASYAGGIAGYIAAGQKPAFEKCSYTGTISNTAAAGGICAAAPQGAAPTIRNCVAGGTYVNCTRSAGLAEAAAFILGTISGNLSLNNDVDIVDGAINGTAEGNCSFYFSTLKATPITAADLYKAVWILNSSAGADGWMVKDGKIAFTEPGAETVNRIYISRIEDAADKDAAFRIEIVTEIEGESVYQEAEQGVDSVSLYGGAELKARIKVTKTSDPAEPPLLIKQETGAVGTIEVIEETENSVTYQLTAGGSDLSLYYGTQIDKDSITTTEWYDESGVSFEISTFGALKGFAQLVNEGNDFDGKTVTLTKEITIPEGYAWTPIGKTNQLPFKGTFDGGGNTIYGVTVDVNVNRAGFFGQIDGATVRNLTLADGSVSNSATGAAYYTGGIVGSANNGSSIENCVNGLQVEGPTVGGIAGYINNSSITECVNEAPVTGTGTASTAYAGGICGNVSSGSEITYCQNTEGIYGKSFAGGIAGSLASNTVSKACMNVGNVEASGGAKKQGSIVGKSSNGKILSCLSYVEGSDLFITGTAGASDTYDGNFYLGEDDETYGMPLTEGEFKHISLVGDLNQSLGENFWGFGYEDDTYQYPIFADHGKNPVYSITISPAGKQTGDLSKKEIENDWGHKVNTYYGKEDLSAEMEKKGLSFMVIQDGKIEMKKDSAAVSVQQEGTAANVTVYYGTEEEFETLVFTEWYSDKETSFTISSPGQLAGLAQLVDDGKNFDGKTLILEKNLDLSEICGQDNPWKPIGWWASSSANRFFSGTFDGNGYTISGLYAYKDSSAADTKGTDGIGKTLGLFGATDSATIQNLTVKGTVIWEQEETSGNANSGGVGGILGLNYKGRTVLKGLTNYVSVTSKSFYVGGIAGFINQGAQAGNGSSWDEPFIGSDLTNYGKIEYNGTKAAFAGGIFGQLWGGQQGAGDLLRTQNSGTISNSSGYAGGILGGYKTGYTYKEGGHKNITNIYHSYNKGMVEGKTAAGIIAFVSGTAVNNDKSSAQPIVTNVVSVGEISGTEKAYGTINDASVSNSMWGTGIHAIADAAKEIYYDNSKLEGETQSNDVGEGLETAQFASGKIAYALDNGGTDLKRAGIWGQDTKTGYPAFQSAAAPAVYRTIAAEAKGGTLSLKEGGTDGLAILGEESMIGEGTAYYTAGAGTMTLLATSEEGYSYDSFHAYEMTSNVELDVEANQIEEDQDTEQFALSIQLPAGTDVKAEATFINTPDNIGEQMTLILDGNGGSWRNGDTKKSVDTMVGTRYYTIEELKDTESLQNGKFEFTGWYLDKDCEDPVDEMRMIVPETGTTTLTVYAGWDTAAVYYQVSLNANGGSFPEGVQTEEDGTVLLTVKEGNVANISASYHPTKTDYQFSGWYYDEEMTMPYSDEPIEEETVLYAGYQKPGEVNISFHANGGYFTIDGKKVSSYQKSVAEGTELTLEMLAIPAVRRDMEQGVGYKFAGWLTDTDQPWSDGITAMQNLTYFAAWESIDSFEEWVEHVKEQNQETGENPGIYINDYETLQALQKYIASGKSTSEDYFVLGADITLQSDWAGINKFYGTFDGNGHTITYNNVTTPLFQSVNGTVSNINIAGTGKVSGGLAETMGPGAVIDHCVITSGTTLSGENIGGIVGSIDQSGSNVYTIKNCAVEDGATIKGTGNMVGGIVGSVIGDSSGSAIIENCTVGDVDITGKGKTDLSGNPSDGGTGSGIGGLGGILGYGSAQISGCSADANLSVTGSKGYGIGGIVGTAGETQGGVTIEKSSFTGSIYVEEGNSIGGILGARMGMDNFPADLNDVYCTADITVNKGTAGGILGNNYNNGTVKIENAYWNGTAHTTPDSEVYAIANGNGSKIDVTNAYYSTNGDALYGDSFGTEKEASAFVSGELAYELDKNHNPRGTWTQGENGPEFGSGPEDAIYKVEVEKTETVTWPDGTTAEVTTTVSSELSEKAGLTDCDTVYVKHGETVTTTVTGLPPDKVVKNEDGSTTTTTYTVTVKDKDGNTLDGTPIMENKAGTGAGQSSSTNTPGGEDPGTGGGTGGGSGTGDKPGTGDGQGDGTGEGDGSGDGDQSQGGTGEEGEQHPGQSGESDQDNNQGSSNQGTVTPNSNPSATPADVTPVADTTKQPTETPSVDALESKPTNEGGNQSQGGGEQGTIEPESQIYKIMKKIADAVTENPVATAAIAAGIIAIILLGAYRRKKKEEKQ